MDFRVGKRKHLHPCFERSILRVWKRFRTLFTALDMAAGTLAGDGRLT